MKRLRNHLVGVEEGTLMLFSDFEDGGEMWTGTGPRLRRHVVSFSEMFRTPPTVFVSMSMWDIDDSSNARADLAAENVNEADFELVFRTWGDTRVARVRGAWMAIGELKHADDWDLY